MLWFETIMKATRRNTFLFSILSLLYIYPRFGNCQGQKILPAPVGDLSTYTNCLIFPPAWKLSDKPGPIVAQETRDNGKISLYRVLPFEKNGDFAYFKRTRSIGGSAIFYFPVQNPDGPKLFGIRTSTKTPFKLSAQEKTEVLLLTNANIFPRLKVIMDKQGHWNTRIREWLGINESVNALRLNGYANLYCGENGSVSTVENFVNYHKQISEKPIKIAGKDKEAIEKWHKSLETFNITLTNEKFNPKSSLQLVTNMIESDEALLEKSKNKKLDEKNTMTEYKYRQERLICVLPEKKTFLLPIEVALPEKESPVDILIHSIDTKGKIETWRFRIKIYD